MRKPSDNCDDWDSLRERIIGLGEHSARKSYFPELQQHLRELEKAKEKLQENEELLSTIINSMPNPVFYKDADGIYLGCNDAFSGFLGISKEKIIGATPFDIAPRKLAEVYHQADMELMKKSGTQTYEAAVRYADGTLHNVVFYKSVIPNQDGTIRGLVGVMLDITERKHSEEALRLSEEMFRLLFEKSGDAKLLLDGTEFIDCNEATIRMLGYSDKSRVLHAHPSDLSPERQPDGRLSAEKYNEMVLTAFKSGSHRFEWLHRRADGSDLPVEVNLTAIPMHGRWLLHTAWRDLTDRMRAEEEKERLAQRLLQAQKIESIGRLAGGVAHDFNNLLTPIMGYAEMLRNSCVTDERNLTRINGILDAAAKARDLTRQLLAFGRKQLLEMKPLDLGQVIEEFSSILERTIREDVAISLKLEPALGMVMADRSQVEQIIMNLAINAQDAMPTGGSLIIETANLTLNKGFAKGIFDLPAGSYVKLTVSDTGCGMDTETMNHIFEPFFTTKDQGKGTGLGLATVFGIAKQHGGNIFVYSEPGCGTTFRIFFPRIEDQPAEYDHGEDSQTDIAKLHSATILLVEDNPIVREMTCELLAEHGYTVLMTDGADQAIERLREFNREVDLLLSDVIMPKMSGPALFEALKLLQPNLKALYMSGYTENIIAHHGKFEGSSDYIQKPFTVSAMISKIEETIGRGNGSRDVENKDVLQKGTP